LHRLRIAALLSLLAIAQSAVAKPVCTLTDVQFATALRTLSTWREINAFHKRHFPPCPDDGMYAEGYSDLVVRTLATNWASLPQLDREAKERVEFLAFVLKHIDASADPTQLRLIHRHAAERCPSGQGALCASLRKAAEAAISELR
jgi:hypothetical protein